MLNCAVKRTHSLASREGSSGSLGSFVNEPMGKGMRESVGVTSKSNPLCHHSASARRNIAAATTDFA